MRETTDNVGLDPKVIARLRKVLDEGRQSIAELAQSSSPIRGVELALAASELIDRLVFELTMESAKMVAARLGATAAELAESVAIVAVGGYGRRELCPRSDLDILFLVPSALPRDVTDPVGLFVNGVLYGLWDLGLEVGHSVRGVAECVRFAIEDQAVKTGLLDARLLSGRDGPPAHVREESFRALLHALDHQLLAGKEATVLIEQKLEESARRRERFGNSIYLLEPNVKASEGGLRDLHTALWVARARWHAKEVRALLRIGVLSPHEERTLERAYGFLLRVRFELHVASGRRHDILGFDHQERIAKTLGYITGGDDPDRRKHGTERFMRAYYFHASQIRRLAQLIIERATSQEMSHPASMQRAPGGFKVWNGMLTVADRDQLARDPTAIVRLFRIAEEEALPIYSYTKDLVVEALWGIDRAVRRNPAVVQDFLALLEYPRGDGSMLALMHELGVLRRLFPEVARMTAKWQHSLYHVYTVDVHSLFVLQHLKRLRSGALSGEHPDLARLVSDLPRPNVLYLAGFFHDIGKGYSGGDHSKRGARVAEVIGKRFEDAKAAAWTSTDTEDFVWLVREHLTMSDISQRRDVSDHDLIESFAASAGSVERLTMLYALTVADMRGTSPKVWSDWKGTLLREVYEVTRAVLSSPERPRALDAGGPDPMDARRARVRTEIEQELEARNQKASTPDLPREFVARMPERYLVAVTPKRMLRAMEMWREVSERGGVALHVRQLRREGSTRVTVVCPDRPGLLAILAGTLAANRIQILSAQIFSIDRGLAVGREAGVDETGRLALDVAYVKDEKGEICDEPARWEQVRMDLLAILSGERDVRQLLDLRLRGSTLKDRPRPPVKTEIAIINDVSKTETVIDVFCQDRLGVLFTIAQALFDAGLSISVAKISTQGDRVADGFYVTDAATGSKLLDKERIEAVKRGLREALDLNRERTSR